MPELLHRVVAALRAANIDHMVVGSFASSFHGEPRATRDIDRVIDPTLDAMATFVHHIAAPGIDAGDGERAFRERSMFNVVDTRSGWKADLIIRKDRAFNRTEFERRDAASVDGVETWIATAEDTIIAKLEWMVASGSEQQRRDVIDLLETIGSDLDRSYVGYWVKQLQLEGAWREVEIAALDPDQWFSEPALRGAGACALGGRVPVLPVAPLH